MFFVQEHRLFGDLVLLPFPWDLKANTLCRDAYLRQKWADSIAMTVALMEMARRRQAPKEP